MIMVEPTGKETLINKLVMVRDTKVRQTDILTLKRTPTPSTTTTVDDLCLLKTKILHEDLPLVHFDPEQIMLLVEHFESEQQAIHFKKICSLFLNIDEGILAKM